MDVNRRILAEGIQGMLVRTGDATAGPITDTLDAADGGPNASAFLLESPLGTYRIIVQTIAEAT